MIAISLCMIVRNEEKTLSRCLSSVGGAADEIIIVDTGSDDRTKETAAAFGARVYDFEWADDFSAARNYAFSKATMEYQMWLDADDVLPPEEAEKLLSLKASLPPQTDVVTMKYHTHFDEAGNPVLTSRRGRLFRREKGFLWRDRVHEYIPMTGLILPSDIAVCHKKEASSGDRNLRIYESMLAHGEMFQPRSVYYYARELMDHGRYEDASLYFNRFLDGGEGWVEDNIAACLALGRCCGWLNRPDERIRALLRSFMYDLPRPETCCELGYGYMSKGDYERAAYWFDTALSAPARDNGGFVLSDYAEYIPHIELCVCRYKLGDLEGAVYHNEKAGRAKPGNSAVEFNREFFCKV